MRLRERGERGSLNYAGKEGWGGETNSGGAISGGPDGKGGAGRAKAAVDGMGRASGHRPAARTLAPIDRAGDWDGERERRRRTGRPLRSFRASLGGPARVAF